MATRSITFAEWFKLVRKHALDAGFANLAGHPPVNVAKRLDLSKQRVHELVRGGVLDTIEITNAAGAVAMTLITEASVERYLAKRVPDRGRQGYFAFP